MRKSPDFGDKLRTSYVIELIEAPKFVDLYTVSSPWFENMINHAAENFSLDAEIETLERHRFNQANPNYPAVLEVPVSGKVLQHFRNEYRWRREHLIKAIR